MKTWVGSQDLLSGLRIHVALSCGVGCRCSSDPMCCDFGVGGSYSSDSTPSLGTSIGRRFGLKKQKEKKKFVEFQLRRDRIGSVLDARDTGSNPSPAQWVKHLALPQLWLRSQLATQIWSLAWELPMPWGGQKTNKNKNKNRSSHCGLVVMNLIVSMRTKVWSLALFSGL